MNFKKLYLSLCVVLSLLGVRAISADEASAPKKEPSAILFSPTKYKNPDHAGPVWMAMGEASGDDLGSKVKDLAPVLSEMKEVEFEVAMPRNMPKAEQQEYMDWVRSQVSQDLPNVKIRPVYLDVEKAGEGGAPQKGVLGYIKRQASQLKEWAKGIYPFSRSWFGSQKTSVMYGVGISVVQGAISAKGWITASGMPLSARLAVAAGAFGLDFASARYQTEFSRLVRMHRLIPFLSKDNVINRLYNSTPMQMVKSLVGNWLIYYIARPGLDQGVNVAFGRDHDPSVGSFAMKQLKDGSRDIGAYMPWEMALENLRYKGKITIPGQRYMISSGNVMYTIYLLMRAQGLEIPVPLPEMLLGPAPLALFIPWVYQLGTAGAEKFIPSTDHRLLAVHPSLQGNEAQLHQLRPVEDAMKVNEFNANEIEELAGLLEKAKPSDAEIARTKELKKKYGADKISESDLKGLTQEVLKMRAEDSPEMLSAPEVVKWVESLGLKKTQDGYRYLLPRSLVTKKPKALPGASKPTCPDLTAELRQNAS